MANLADILQNADVARFGRRWADAADLYRTALPMAEGWVAVHVQKQIAEIEAQIAFESAVNAFDDAENDADEFALALEVIRLSNGCAADNSQRICWAMDCVTKRAPIGVDA